MIPNNSLSTEINSNSPIFKRGRRKNNCRTKIAVLVLMTLFVLTLFIGISCSDLPSLTDIEQLNDRIPPVFTFDYPADGDIYGDIVRVKGKVVDEEEAENQAQRIKTVFYSVNENYPEITVPINDNGAFLVSFSTYHLDGNLTILFKATDISGNTGIKTLSLVEPPPPTPEPVPTPTFTPIPTETPGPTSIPSPTSTPLPSLTPEPGPTKYPPGTVWFEPENVTVSEGSSFITEIHVNTGTQSLAAYGFDFYYNFSIMDVNYSGAYNGIEAGPYGFISAVNANTAGVIIVSGFDTTGTPPATDLHFLTGYWRAVRAGSSYLSVTVYMLADPSTATIGNPTGMDCMVTVQSKK